MCFCLFVSNFVAGNANVTRNPLQYYVRAGLAEDPVEGRSSSVEFIGVADCVDCGLAVATNAGDVGERVSVSNHSAAMYRAVSSASKLQVKRAPF